MPFYVFAQVESDRSLVFRDVPALSQNAFELVVSAQAQQGLVQNEASHTVLSGHNRKVRVEHARKSAAGCKGEDVAGAGFNVGRLGRGRS